MSAVVCGKRSLFDEIHPPTQKRLRCGGGTSPVRFSSLWSGSPGGSPTLIEPSDLLSQLRNLFPDMDEQLIEKVLESTGNNLDSTIKSLNELRLSSDVVGSTSKFSSETVAASMTHRQEGAAAQSDTLIAAVDVHKGIHGQNEWSEWADLFVKEMLSAANLDDAKDRASKALDAFEKTVLTRSSSVFEEFQKENASLKEQIQNLVRENHILKRAITIQHERQAEHDNCPQEIQRLKQLVSEYQIQVRNLELNNYALNVHLRKAQEGSSIPGRFHPDVF